MKVRVVFEFECGDKTCSTPDGKSRCLYVRSRRFGTEWCCALLEGEKLETSEAHGNGWLLRHKKCLEMAEKYGVQLNPTSALERK